MALLHFLNQKRHAHVLTHNFHTFPGASWTHHVTEFPGIPETPYEEFLLYTKAHLSCNALTNSLRLSNLVGWNAEIMLETG